MEPDTEIVKLDSIDAYNNLYGLEAKHPLVTVIDLTKATKVVNHVRIDYSVYALFLKNGTNCTLKYGRQAYDYQEGSIVSFSPGQQVSVDMEIDEIAPDVTGIMFHPDLIYKTPLASKIKEYRFFDYSQREALHLSADERRIFTQCLQQINEEISHPIDKHTAGIVASQIQLLLDYVTRFYERQFITRKTVNSNILNKFESSLREYLKSGQSMAGLPTVSYFAAAAHLTPGYFSDLIKRETGLTPQEIISRHIIELAKQRLADSKDDVSVIAYELGFQHPQHFSRMFKRGTGISPTLFRKNTIAATTIR